MAEKVHTVTTDRGRKIHLQLVRPVYSQPNHTNRGKGPRDAVTQWLSHKCSYALKKRSDDEPAEEEVLLLEIPQPEKTSRLKPGQSVQEKNMGNSTVDLT